MHRRTVMGNIIKVDFAQKIKKLAKAHVCPDQVMTVVDDRSDVKPINWHKAVLFVIVIGIVALAIWSKS